MDDHVRSLIREVCYGDINKIRTAALIVCKNSKTKKDEAFCESAIKKIEATKNLVELPYDLRGILVQEDVSNYSEERYFWRDDEVKVAERVISMYRVADKLHEKGIRYIPSVVLYGESGCGKTELARYIAHKAGLNYVYVRFSALIDSYLGKTQKNISKIFDYLRNSKCVVCFDEIDAIGMDRCGIGDVGEMSRVVISLMQELDTLPNSVILVGTTNRFDRLDKALVRRFSISHEVNKMNEVEAKMAASNFLKYAGCSYDDIQNYVNCIIGDVPASKIVKDCTEFVAEMILKDMEV